MPLDMMMNTRFRLLAILVPMLFPALQAHADSIEIQVYRDEIADRGESNFDFGANFSKASRKSELKGRSISQAMGEFSYGVTDHLEVGIKVPVFHIDGLWHGNGALAEMKYVAPHAPDGFYWGMEIEAGQTQPFLEVRQWVLEAVPIIGFRDGAWHVTANPGLSITSAGEQKGVVTFEPNAKLSYQLHQSTAIGIEYFSEAGPLHSILPSSQRNEVAFLALDTKLGHSALNIGLGHGTNSISATWVAKFLVDIEFD